MSNWESDELRLVSFMDYDLGCLDHETCRLEPLDNPFGPSIRKLQSYAMVLAVKIVQSGTTDRSTDGRTVKPPAPNGRS